MTHTETTAAVRASLLLADNTAERHGTYLPRSCVCGHVSGDHQSGRARSLNRADDGPCLISGCECRAFASPRLIADGMRVA